MLKYVNKNKSRRPVKATVNCVDVLLCSFVSRFTISFALLSLSIFSVFFLIKLIPSSFPFPIFSIVLSLLLSVPLQFLSVIVSVYFSIYLFRLSFGSSLFPYSFFRFLCSFIYFSVFSAYVCISTDLLFFFFFCVSFSVFHYFFIYFCLYYILFCYLFFLNVLIFRRSFCSNLY